MKRRFLIDTNILLFSVSDKDMLSKEVKRHFDDCSNQIYISSESVREAINLVQIGKVRPNVWKSADDIIDFIKNDTMFEIKHISEEHIRTLAKLPMLKEHRDVSDRMIIAHAITEKLTLISSDTHFTKYIRFGLDLLYNPKK
jgi:PIN domain nuclease of toxin-antitoxin system